MAKNIFIRKKILNKDEIEEIQAIINEGLNENNKFEIQERGKTYELLGNTNGKVFLNNNEGNNLDNTMLLSNFSVDFNKKENNKLSNACVDTSAYLKLVSYSRNQIFSINDNNLKKALGKIQDFIKEKTGENIKFAMLQNANGIINEFYDPFDIDIIANYLGQHNSNDLLEKSTKDEKYAILNENMIKEKSFDPETYSSALSQLELSLIKKNIFRQYHTEVTSMRFVEEIAKKIGDPSLKINYSDETKELEQLATNKDYFDSFSNLIYGENSSHKAMTQEMLYKNLLGQTEDDVFKSLKQVCPRSFQFQKFLIENPELTENMFNKMPEFLRDELSLDELSELKLNKEKGLGDKLWYEGNRNITNTIILNHLGDKVDAENIINNSLSKKIFSPNKTIGFTGGLESEHKENFHILNSVTLKKDELQKIYPSIIKKIKETDTV